MEQLPLLIALLGALVFASLLAPRLHAPLPVTLALCGAIVGLMPGVPRLPLDPDLILVLFLPPLLYADAFHTSWNDFRRWLRPILMLAIGLVGLTVLTVGVAAHACLPELPWTACFLLGAIVSPTDTVAVQAAIARLRIPRRITAILGGESLVNDATGLVGVQLCIAVILSGTFEASSILVDFTWVAGMGVAVGLVAGALFTAANRYVRDRAVLFVLSLLAPYMALWGAIQLGASGVLAVVVAGFMVAWRVHLIPPDARVELYSSWDMLVFVLNGLCFLFVGLEAPFLLIEFETHSLSNELLVAGLAVSGAVILTRIAWCLPGAYLPLLFSKRLREREGGVPPLRNVALVSWCGVRGAVSLAAALSIPASLPDGSPFPGREAILACALVVILVTLVAQGLTLSPLIRLLGLREDEDGATEVRAARERLLEAGIARLDAYCSETSCPLSVHRFREHMADGLASLRELDAEQRGRAETRLAVSQEVHKEVANAQDAELLALRDSGRINDLTYVALQLELDRQNMGAR